MLYTLAFFFSTSSAFMVIVICVPGALSLCDRLHWLRGVEGEESLCQQEVRVGGTVGLSCREWASWI